MKGDNFIKQNRSYWNYFWRYMDDGSIYAAQLVVHSNWQCIEVGRKLMAELVKPLPKGIKYVSWLLRRFVSGT
jgi:hypothetical protein